MESVPLGVTNMFTGEISLYRGLDKYPELKKIVLEHEIRHRENDKNFLQVFIREIIEYPQIMFSKHHIKFLEDEAEKIKWWARLILAPINSIYVFFTIGYSVLLTILLSVYILILKVFNIEKF